jgi:hypothetical protein
MSEISLQAIEATAIRLGTLEQDEEIEALIDQLGEEQPLLLAYLIEMGEDDFDEEEQSIFLYLGTLIYEVLRNELAPLPALDEAALEAAEANNLALLEQWSDEKPEAFGHLVDTLAKGYAQGALLGYMRDVLEEEVEEKALRPANLLPMFFFLKVMVDFLATDAA